MKKTALILSLLAGLSATATSYAAFPQTVRTGTDTTYALFSSKDAKGDFVGFDIDLGNEMCKCMQIKCTWVVSNFDVLTPSLKVKKIDVIISSLSITEERQQEIASPDKLYAVDLCLTAVKGSLIQLTLDSLKGKHTGVLQGSTQEVYVNDNWRSKGVDVVVCANQGLIYSDLTAGRLDAVLQDEVVVGEGFLKQPVSKDYVFAGPSVKDKKYFGDETGISLREGDAELKTAFDKAPGELRKDGTYDKIASEYSNFNVYGD